MRHITSISTKQLARSIAEHEARDRGPLAASDPGLDVEDRIPTIRRRLRKIVEEINAQRDEDARKADVDALIGDEPSVIWDIYSARSKAGDYIDEDPVTL